MKFSVPKSLIFWLIFALLANFNYQTGLESANQETSDNERQLEGEGDPPTGEEGAGFDAEAEEKTLSEAIIAEVPKTFTCADAEKKITCTDATLAYLKFKITYKAAAVNAGGGKKRIFYTVTVGNGPAEGEDTYEFHAAYRVKFEKDEKSVNLKQKMAWLLGGNANDANRPNFLADLKRLVPIDMKQVKMNAKVNELLDIVFASRTNFQGEQAYHVIGPCKYNTQNSCSIRIYPTDANYLRIQFQMGRSASNYAVPRSNFNQVFPIYANAILAFIQREGTVQAQLGFPLNRDMAKSLLLSSLVSTCNACVLGTETDMKESSFNLFSKNFVYPRTVAGRKVDEKYSVIGVYYNFEGWNYEHVLLDSEKQQEEIMLNTNSALYAQLFAQEFVGFIQSNDYSLINTSNEVALTIEILKTKIKPLIGTCTIADGKDPATSFVVKCGTAEVLSVTEIAKENDTGFKIDYLLLIPKGGMIPDTGFVLQKVNSFDQVAAISPLIKQYIASVDLYIKTRWAVL